MMAPQNRAESEVVFVILIRVTFGRVLACLMQARSWGAVTVRLFNALGGSINNA